MLFPHIDRLHLFHRLSSTFSPFSYTSSTSPAFQIIRTFTMNFSIDPRLNIARSFGFVISINFAHGALTSSQPSKRWGPAICQSEVNECAPRDIRWLLLDFFIWIYTIYIYTSLLLCTKTSLTQREKSIYIYIYIIVVVWEEFARSTKYIYKIYEYICSEIRLLLWDRFLAQSFKLQQNIA